MEEFEKYLMLLIFTILAFIAGGVNYLKETKEFLFSKFMVEASASGLVGLLVTLLCISCGVDQYLTGAIAGFAGFLGADTVKGLFKRIFKEKTGFDLDEDADKKSA